MPDHNEVFLSNFEDGEAPARRYINPNDTPGGIVAVSAKLGKDVFVSANSRVGPDATVEEGTHLDSTRVGRGAMIGKHARLRYTLVGAKSAIGDFVMIAESTIGSNVGIGSRTSVSSSTIAPDSFLGDSVSFRDCVAKTNSEIGDHAKVVGAIVCEGASVAPYSHIEAKPLLVTRDGVVVQGLEQNAPAPVIR